MRITSGTMLLSAMRQLRAGQSTVARAQSEAATGRRVQTVSDDPVSATRILQLQGEVRALDQYTRNGASANTRLSTEDTVLSSVRDLLSQARSIAISATSADPASPDRRSALDTVNGLIQQVISLGNTQVGGESIFAGARTDGPAFRADGSYAGDATVRTVALDRGVSMNVNDTGDTVISPVINALQALATQLQSGTPAQIQATVPTLVAADDTVLGAQSAVGGRLQQVKNTAQDLAARTATLLDQRDLLRDADPAESAVRLTAAQSALERAYAAIGKMFSTSLADYLS